MNKTILMNAKNKEQSFTIDYIRLYRQLPELWNIKSRDYHDRRKRKAGYETLLRKYKEFYTEASIEDLKKKINTLRTNYRKELRKRLKNKEKSSSLWYFEELSFLDNVDLSQDPDSSENTHFLIEYIDDEDTVFETCPSPVNREIPKESPKDPKKEENKDQPSQNVDITEFKQIHIEMDHPKIFPSPSNTYIHKKTNGDSQAKDEYYHWAMACAADLRNMSQNQQFYAKKAIAEIIMEGQLGTLDRNSVKINHFPPLCEIDPLPYEEE